MWVSTQVVAGSGSKSMSVHSRAPHLPGIPFNTLCLCLVLLPTDSQYKMATRCFCQKINTLDKNY